MSDLIQQIKETKEALSKLEKQLEQQDKHLRRADEGIKYHFARYDLKTSSIIEAADEEDNLVFNSGNYFLKESHAQSLADHRKKWGQVERLIIEFNDGWEPDWSSRDQVKGFATWNHDCREWVVSYSKNNDAQGSIVFDFNRSKEVYSLLNKYFPNGPEA